MRGCQFVQCVQMFPSPKDGARTDFLKKFFKKLIFTVCSGGFGTKEKSKNKVLSHWKVVRPRFAK